MKRFITNCWKNPLTGQIRNRIFSQSIWCCCILVAVAGWCCVGPTTMASAMAVQESISETGDDINLAEPKEEKPYASVNGFEIGNAELRLLLDELQPVSRLQSQQLQMLEMTETQLKTAQTSRVTSEEFPTINPKLREALIQHWIERLLVLSYLQTQDLAVSEQQIAAELKRQEELFQARGDNLKTSLQKRNIKTAVYETHLAWKLGWKRFVDDRVNDQSLDKYYRISHRRFDGTQLKIAHVVRTFQGVSTEDEKKSLVIQFQDLKQQIDNKEVTFEEAAAKWSEGSSAKSGGELGWIDFAGPLGPEVTQAAFETTVGEISSPVVTDSAVHLVRVLEEKAGDIPFAENRDRVRSAMIHDLWNWTVDQQRGQVSIVRH